MQRPSRLTERSGAMTRDKRGLDQVDAEERQPESKKSKVPALARSDFKLFVIFEVNIGSLLI